MSETIKVPDIGDFKDVLVVEVLVKVGDVVKIDTPLVTLETDKATMDVPSPAAGTITAIALAVGQQVSMGSVILELERGATNVQNAPVSAKVEPAKVEPPARSAAEPALVRASPAVRKAAREAGIDLATVVASGFGGRVSREDLAAHGTRSVASGLGAGLPAWPHVDHAQYGPIERAPLSRLKKIAGGNLARNWLAIPHVTNFDEADVTDLEAFRQTINREQGPKGTKVTMLAFLLKASVTALQRHPAFNSSLDGDSLIHKRYWHLGFAADTPDGLMVPVVRDVDRKGVLEIARETSTLAGQAREGKLKLADMQGGTFTVSSLGGIGGTGFTPIINAPEVAILGVTKAQTKPVWDGSQFQPRLMLPLCLSWDHRVIDGAAAARFLVELAGLLGDFRRTLL